MSGIWIFVISVSKRVSYICIQMKIRLEIDVSVPYKIVNANTYRHASSGIITIVGVAYVIRQSATASKSQTPSD